MGTLRDFIEEASGYAERMFSPDDVLMPHFIAEAADGGIIVAALCMGGRDLDLMRKAMALKFEREGLRRWVFFAESWYVEYAAGMSRDEPQDHPGRIEVVSFDAFDLAGNRRVRAIRQILRVDGQGARLMPIVIHKSPVIDVPTRAPRVAR